jgi:hypothetical protein
MLPTPDSFQDSMTQISMETYVKNESLRCKRRTPSAGVGLWQEKRGKGQLLKEIRNIL